MKNIRYIAIVLLLLVLQACSPKPQQVTQTQLDLTPEWITNPLEDTTEFLYSTGSFVSSRRASAEQQAVLLARTNMASKLSTKIEALEKLFMEEVSSGERANFSSAFTLATQSITSQTLTGATPHRVEFRSMPDGRFEAFVLTRMPVGEARAALENALSNDEEMFVRFKESQAFKELMDNLERLGQ